MNKFLLSLSLIAFSYLAGAQTNNHVFESNYPKSKSSFGIDAAYSINSNAVTNKFVNSYLNNKFIDADLKDASLNKMKNENHLGSSFTGGLTYRHKTKNNAGYFISAHERTYFNTTFSKDLFQLYFYGNRPFAGKTADINNFNYRGIQYQQLEFGLFKDNIKKDKAFGYAVSLSVLNGQNYLEIKSTTGTLFTQADAEYIDMNLALEATQSDTTSKKFGSSNGIGASLNLNLNYSSKDKYRICFSATDLGFIAWNNKSTTFKVDTNYHFDGVYVDNLFDSLYLDLSSEQDFKDGFKEDKQQKSFTSALPLCFNLSYQRTFIFASLTVEVGAEYIANADYTPLFYLSTDYYISSRVHAGFTVMHGGYGGFNGGLHADVDFSHGLILSVGSRFISGFITPDKSTGQGAYASLRKIF